MKLLLIPSIYVNTNRSDLETICNKILSKDLINLNVHDMRMINSCNKDIGTVFMDDSLTTEAFIDDCEVINFGNFIVLSINYGSTGICSVRTTKGVRKVIDLLTEAELSDAQIYNTGVIGTYLKGKL